MTRSAADWISHLDLAPHPEGGHFRESYRAQERVAGAHLPARYGGERAFSTAIYFLLREGEVSAFHRIKSDEIWHFYAGGALGLFVIHPGGDLRQIALGPDPDHEQSLQVVVPAGAWFGASPGPGTAYSLVGCTVAPGFEFADFELGNPRDLAARYPRHTALIERLAR